MRQKFFKLSLFSFIISAVTYVINYIVYHYVTDDGFTSIKQEVAGKPFVSDLIGQFVTLFLFASIICILIAIIFYPKKNN